MLYNNNRQTNFIGTDESVYRDSPIGNLEEFSVKRILPLQQGFYCDILTRISIGVHDNSAFLAPEQGIIGTAVSLPNSTAVGTELGCMPRINDIQRNILVKAPLDKVILEGKKRNPHDLTVEAFAFRTESLKILNGNVSIISKSHFSNLPNDFAYSILHEVMFIAFSPIQCLIRIGTSSIGITTQSGLPLEEFSSSLPNILSEVILMQNLSFRRHNSNGKTLAVHINSKNILPQRQFDFILGKICNNLKIASESISLASPSTLQKVEIPLEVAVLDNKDTNGILRKQRKFDKRQSHIKNLAVARNIKLESNSFRFAFASPDIAFNIADNL
jgi:hypothetical protein